MSTREDLEIFLTKTLVSRINISNSDSRFYIVYIHLLEIEDYTKKGEIKLKKKYLALIVILAISSTTVVSALLVLNLTYDIELTDEGEAIILNDDLGSPIVSLVLVPMYVGQTETLVFQLVNAYSGAVTVTMTPSVPTGWDFTDGEFGVRLNGIGDISGLVFGTSTIIPVGEYLEVWLGISNIGGSTPGEVGSLDVLVEG